MACHSDQSLAPAGRRQRAAEREVLGAIRYHPNRAVLHTDASVLPRRKLAWAAWNYARAESTGREQTAVCLHYLINLLQPLPWEQPVVVSLNPDPAHHRTPARCWPTSNTAPRLRPGRHSRAAAPARHSRRGGLWFCGAWTRYGFHEDGLMSGAGRGTGSAPHLAGRRSTGTRSGWRHERGHGAHRARAWLRHRRLRPHENAFAYPTYFVMLPMRSLRTQPCAGLPRNRAGCSASTTRTTATAAPMPWPGWTNCCWPKA